MGCGYMPVKTRRLAWGSDTVHAGSRPETHHTSNKDISLIPELGVRACTILLSHAVSFLYAHNPSEVIKGSGGRTVGAGAEVDVGRRAEGQHSHHRVVERTVLVRTDALPVPVLVQQDVVGRLIRGEDAWDRGAARSEG